MDNIRVFLWLTLLGMAWLVYTAWVADYGARPPPNAGSSPDATQSQTGEQLPDLPALSDQAAAPQVPTVAAERPAATGELIRVQTDVLDGRISSQGGDWVRADLP